MIKLKTRDDFNSQEEYDECQKEIMRRYIKKTKTIKFVNNNKDYTDFGPSYGRRRRNKNYFV